MVREVQNTDKLWLLLGEKTEETRLISFINAPGSGLLCCVQGEKKKKEKKVYYAGDFVSQKNFAPKPLRVFFFYGKRRFYRVKYEKRLVLFFYITPSFTLVQIFL